MTTDEILIAGGGIGGLAAALALARLSDRRVRVLEQASSFGEVGAGIQLGPNVFKMFEILGLVDAITDVAAHPKSLVMRDAKTGGEVTRVPLGDGIVDRFGHPYAVIYRPDLHKVLLDACAADDRVTLETDQKIGAIRPEGNGISVTVSGVGTIGAPALIGADGLWSTVRGYVADDGPPRVSGHIAYRGVLPMDQVPDGVPTEDVLLWAGPKTHLVHYPLRRGELFNIVAVFHSDRYEEGWNEYGDPDELQSKFAGQHPIVLNLLSRIESWRMWVLCDREPIREWSRGPVTLLGDAAHPMLQYLAQGACMAIEDAVCLAHKISSHGAHFPAAFRAYQADRYLRTGRVQLTARFYGDVYHASGVTAELRNLFLGRKGGGPYDGVAWLYGGVDETGAQML